MAQVRTSVRVKEDSEYCPSLAETRRSFSPDTRMRQGFPRRTGAVYRVHTLMSAGLRGCHSQFMVEGNTPSLVAPPLKDHRP